MNKLSHATSLLGNLSNVARIVNSGRDPQDILDRIAFSVCCNSLAIQLHHGGRSRRGSSIQVAKFNHFISDENLHQVWQLNLSPTVEVLDTGRPLIIPDALMDRKYIDYWIDAQVQRFRTVVLLPLGVSDELGRPMILSVHAAERLEITEDDLRFLSTLADLAGIAVDKGLNSAPSGR